MVEHPLPVLGYSNPAHFKTSDEANAVMWLRYMVVYSTPRLPAPRKGDSPGVARPRRGGPHRGGPDALRNGERALEIGPRARHDNPGRGARGFPGRTPVAREVPASRQVSDARGDGERPGPGARTTPAGRMSTSRGRGARFASWWSTARRERDRIRPAGGAVQPLRIVFRHLPAPRRAGPTRGLFLRTVRGAAGPEGALFRIELLRDGVPAPFQPRAGVARLVLDGGDREVAICIPEAGTVRFRGTGAGLRLAIDPGRFDYDCAVPLGADRWRVTSFTHRVACEARPLSGTLRVEAPWRGDHSEYANLDFLPGGPSGTMEGILSEIDDDRTVELRELPAFEDACRRVRDEVDAWRERLGDPGGLRRVRDVVGHRRPGRPLREVSHADVEKLDVPGLELGSLLQRARARARASRSVLGPVHAALRPPATGRAPPGFRGRSARALGLREAAHPRLDAFEAHGAAGSRRRGTPAGGVWTPLSLGALVDGMPRRRARRAPAVRARQ